MSKIERLTAEQIEIMDTKSCQNITLWLSDGSQIKATVPTFCNIDEINQLSIVYVSISSPYELPEDCRWEVIEPKQKADK